MTRFEVVITKRMKETRGITVSGTSRPVESILIEQSVDEVRCGWCGEGESVTEIGPLTTRADGVHVG